MTRLDARITVYEGASARPVGAARTPVSARRGCLLSLTDRDGRVGQGEASPLPHYSLEGFDDVRAALDDVRPKLTEALLDDPLKALDAPFVSELPASSRFAVETAVCDLAAQRRGVPLHALLSDERTTRVEVSAYAGAALDASLDDAMRDAVARGIRVVKVKLSGADGVFARELDVLRARRFHGELRTDVNGGWSPDEAPDRMEALAAVGSIFVEQPVAPGSLQRLAERTAPWDVARRAVWAADESLAHAEDVAWLVREGARAGCRVAVVKPAMHGLLGALRLAQRMFRARMGLVVTHLFDGPVALAAAMELALALPVPAPCGLDAHAGLALWPAVDLPQRDGARYLRPAARAGLGLAPLPPPTP